MAQEEVGFSNAGASKGNGGCSARLRRFGRSVCNTEKGEFFGRTASSWAKIGIFYIIFYACLAGFFAAMLVGFFATLDDKSPTQKHMYSLIKGNPGMGFRPMSSIDSTLISVKPNEATNIENNVAKIQEFLAEYRKPQEGEVVNCSSGFRTEDDAVCLVEENFGPCNVANKFGYADGKPCVLLKLNKVYDWTPKPFANMSDQSEEIQKRYQDAQKHLGSRLSQNHVGISCEGENEADLDLMGPVSFYPAEGFSYNYYPYKNQKGYRSPVVFAQFENPAKGVLIQIWCKLWAANIKHHKNDKAGSTHFEMMMENV